MGASFNGKAYEEIYKHKDWEQTADKYEEAFAAKLYKRRMTFMIPVEQPREETRLRLWQKVFPEKAPLEEDIDFGVYARIAELTGSNIKSADLAAYRAAAEHRKISNRDIIEAIDFEYRRSGRMGISNELYGELYMSSSKSHAVRTQNQGWEINYYG